jgi:tRNA threonylcarbamoyladenosine modification (KEOPS) complex Cgi121 subunit
VISVNSGEKFLIKVASSRATIEELLLEIAKINRDKEAVVQIFDPGRVINRTHLAGAYINAVEAFKGKTNISKSRGLEMLLFASMTNQINDAIKLVGAKDSKEFVLFANNSAAFGRVSHLLKSSKEFTRSKRGQLEAAARFGIYAKGDLDKFILQKMAISRLGD